MVSREDQIDELEELLGQDSLAVGDRCQLGHLGLDIGGALFCGDFGCFQDVRDTRAHAGSGSAVMT